MIKYDYSEVGSSKRGLFYMPVWRAVKASSANEKSLLIDQCFSINDHEESYCNDNAIA